MKILYKDAALRDIEEKQEYIGGTLRNQTAARRLATAILHAVSHLAENPWMGTALNSRYPVETDIRVLVVLKQLIFYRVAEEEVTVLRVLDGRQDYMTILFPPGNKEEP